MKFLSSLFVKLTLLKKFKASALMSFVLKRNCSKVWSRVKFECECLSVSNSEANASHKTACDCVGFASRRTFLFSKILCAFTSTASCNLCLSLLKRRNAEKLCIQNPVLPHLILTPEPSMWRKSHSLNVCYRQRKIAQHGKYPAVLDIIGLVVVSAWKKSSSSKVEKAIGKHSVSETRYLIKSRSVMVSKLESPLRTRHW